MKKVICLILALACFSLHAVCEETVLTTVYSFEEMDAPIAALCAYAEAQRDALLEEYLLFLKDDVNLAALEEVGFDHCEDTIRMMNGQQPKSMVVMVSKEAMERQAGVNGETEITWGAFAPGVALAFGDTIHTATTNKYLANALDRLCLFDLTDIDEITWGGFVLTYYDLDLPQVLTSVYRINEETLLARTQLIYPNPSSDNYNYMMPMELISSQYGFESFNAVIYRLSEAGEEQ